MICDLCGIDWPLARAVARWRLMVWARAEAGLCGSVEVE